MKPLASIALMLFTLFLSGCTGYNHYKIYTEQNRQLQEQRESAERIAGQIPADQRRVMEEVAAAEDRRHQAAVDSRKRQIEGTIVQDTNGVENRNHPLYDFLHGAGWWLGSDALKDVLR